MSHNITELQKKMHNAVGHEVEVTITGSVKKFIGKCVGFTQPLDNEPEIASIGIKVEGHSCIYEIMENEIEELIIK